jgi:hypothetical protein
MNRPQDWTGVAHLRPRRWHRALYDESIADTLRTLRQQL